MLSVQTSANSGTLLVASRSPPGNWTGRVESVAMMFLPHFMLSALRKNRPTQNWPSKSRLINDRFCLDNVVDAGDRLWLKKS